MEYLIAIVATVVIYKLTYKWLDNNGWFNNQLEKGDDKNDKDRFQATNQSPDETEKDKYSKTRPRC